LYLAAFCRRRKSSASIIGATCAFDAKNYKYVDGIFAVSAYWEGDKKLFQFFDFSFQLPSLLVGNRAPKDTIRTRSGMKHQEEKGLARHVFF